MQLKGATMSSCRIQRMYKRELVLWVVGGGVGVGGGLLQNTIIAN
jgi:hypothetical protein